MSCRDRLEAHFKAHEGMWIDARNLLPIAGTFAWRTRVSECRRELGMAIENRQWRETLPDGRTITVSQYCYIKPVEQWSLTG